MIDIIYFVNDTYACGMGLGGAGGLGAAGGAGGACG
jgi:hypothetical protein